MQILISSRDEEKRKRLSAEERLADALRQVSQLTETVSALSCQVAESNASVQQLTGMLLGNGPISISEQVRNAITSSIREEFERREAEMRSAFLKQIESMQAQIAARDNEINRLKQGDNDGDIPGFPITPSTQPSMSQAEVEALQQQNDNLRTALHGQHTESAKYNHGENRNTVDADTMDLDGEDMPEEKVLAVAARIQENRNSRKGIATPRRSQPLHEIAEQANNKIVVMPEGVPSDAKPLGSDKRYRTSYVKGYVRVTCIELMKYIGPDGKIYEAKLPEEYRNCMGRTPATETIIAQILIMHYDQGITIGDIMKWLSGQGLNYGKSTVEQWIAIGADLLAPLDEPLHAEITSVENAHADESPVEMCDKRLPGKGESEDDVEDIVAYFKRWIFSVHAPGLKLTQFFFYKRGRRVREAITEYFKGVRHKLYLHTDGASLYKCFDNDRKGLEGSKGDSIYELIIRIACLVHIRRPFYKLKDVFEEAEKIVTLIDRIFHEDKQIRARYSIPDDIRRERAIILAPLFNELKNELERLLPILEQEEDAPEMLKAVKYALKEFPCMVNCLQDGRLALDNNACERTIRTIAKYRNNSLFVGSPKGGERLARMKSIFANCRAHGINAYDYLCDVFRRIGTIAKDELVNLLAHRWQMAMA